MKNLQPNNYRVSNSLFESIQNTIIGKTEPVAEAENAGTAVDKAHFCATHVEHSLYGQGTCISEQHAEPDENGNIAWYTVQFPTGALKVNTDNLKIVEGKSHTHGKKMAEEAEEIEEAKANDGNLANNYPPYDKVTRGDVIAGRLGKDQMGGKKKVKEENEAVEEETIAEAYLDENHVLVMHPNDKKSNTHVIKIAMKKNEFDKNWRNTSSNHQAHFGHDSPTLSKRDVTHNLKGAKVMDASFDQYKNMVGKELKEAAAAKRSAGTVFDAKVAAQYTKSKPGEKAGFSSKKISTGRVYSKNYEMEKPIKEGLTQTVINYNDFTLEVTDNPTYGDYLNALQSMINTTNEEYQQEMITIAEDAFNEKVDSIIVEAKARATFKAKLTELSSQKGVKILDESYGVEDDVAYVEYTVEKDGAITQYVHVGTVEKK
jgi:hypothetical protein